MYVFYFLIVSKYFFAFHKNKINFVKKANKTAS